MPELTLLVGVLLDLITAVMLSYVGLRVSMLPEPSRALRRSLWFWQGASLFMLLDGGFGMVVLLLDVPFWVATGVLIVRRLVFTIGWLSFGAWLLTLNGGRYHRQWWSYTVLLAGAIFIQTWLQGVAGYEERPWSVGLIPASPTPVWLNALFGAMLFLPTAWQAQRLLMLFPRLSPLQRYRCAAIAGSTILFSVLVILGFINNEWFWYGFLENRSVFTVATGVLFAIRPPWFLRPKGVPKMTTAREFPGLHQVQPR